MEENLSYYEFFKIGEFECPCCKKNKIDPTLVYHLDELRLFLREPIIVTSGYRCPTHNAQVGGSPDSFHMMGKAVDFKFKKPITTERRYKILREIICNGFFKGIGIYENYFHVDSRCVSSCWISKF